MSNAAGLRVSIAIPTAGAGGGLERLLASLREHARACEVVLVDNGSTHPQLAALCAQYGVRPVQCVEAGVARARAAGVAACSGDVVVFLDDDTELRHGSLAELGGFFARHPRVGACGLSVTNELPDAVRERYGWILHLMAESSQGKAWRLASRRESIVVPGAALAVRRSAWESTGCTRTTLAGDYAVHPIRGEDLEVQFRMIRAGWQVWCHPWLEVSHHPAADRFVQARMERVCYWSCAGGAVARRMIGMPGTVEAVLDALRSWLGARLAQRREPSSETARLRRAMAEGTLLGLLRPEAMRHATRDPAWLQRTPGVGGKEAA